MRTDHLDLLHLHQWDGQTPITETIATADELIRAGKIRYWGVSDDNGWQPAKTVYEARAAGLEGPIAHQAYYTPAARDRITTASQLPAYYPLWHRLPNGQDRPEPAEAEFCAEQRGHVLGEDRTGA